MTEYLGVYSDIPFEELVRSLPNKRYKIERCEVESLRELEKLIDHDAICAEDIPDFLKFLDNLYKKLDSIRVIEEKENVDATNIRRVLNWINNLKNSLVKGTGSKTCIVYDESERVFFSPWTSFGCIK